MKNLLFCGAFFLSLFSFTQNINHQQFSEFLSAYVSNNGNVNYKAIKNNPEALNNYLDHLSNSSPNNSWSKNQTLAYWINTYNAFTIKLIIDHYPIKSIKDIKKPWDQKFIPIKGELLSLNYIEHHILRKMDEPRIHFAIVCASYSCPKLQNKAFTAKNLNEQLNQATKGFLNDLERNFISENKLELSKIFKWFEKDFEQKGTLIDFLNKYASTHISKHAKISYKDYNWSLNE